MQQNNHKNNTSKGFTLIELLIAIFIVSIIAPILYQTITTSNEQLTVISSKTENLNKLQRALWFFQQDLYQIVARNVYNDLGNREATLLLENTNNFSSIRFTRINSTLSSPIKHGLQRVEYYINDKEQLVRKIWLVVDAIASTEYYEKPLLEKVSEFKIEVTDQKKQKHNLWPIMQSNFNKNDTSSTSPMNQIPNTAVIKIKIDGLDEISKYYILVDNTPSL